MQTRALALIHDHWLNEPSVGCRVAAMKLWVRHFTKRHPWAADILEWSSAAAVAVLLSVGSLIANT